MEEKRANGEVSRIEFLSWYIAHEPSCLLNHEGSAQVKTVVSCMLSRNFTHISDFNYAQCVLYLSLSSLWSPLSSLWSPLSSLWSPLTVQLKSIYKIRYIPFIGDSDSSSYSQIFYCPSVFIPKVDCIAHVTKRMRSNLRSLVRDYKGKELSY